MDNNFMRMLSNGVGMLNGQYDMDSITPWLNEASTVAFTNLKPVEEDDRSYRWAIRSLVALLEKKTLMQAAHAVHVILNNKDITVLEVKEILKGYSKELPFETIQNIGKLLREGKSYSSISRELKTERATIAKIDKFLGITLARKDKLLRLATIGLEENEISSRKFAEEHSLTHHEARTLINEAKQILEEIKNNAHTN